MSPYQWLSFSVWLLPIPFMILYHSRTARLNFLTYPTITLLLLTAATYPFLLFSSFHSDVLIVYSVTITIGIYVLRFWKNLNYLQALSLAFITSFVASSYWEIPIFLFTIVHRGFIDQAMPLHLLSFFPVIFLLQKLRVTNKRRTIFILLLGLLISVVFMLPLIHTGVLPSFLDTQKYVSPLWLEILWVSNRLICFFPLLYIVYRSKLF